MHYYEVAPSLIIRPGQDVFTYGSAAELSIGQLVRISIGKKLSNGVILKKVPKPAYDVKMIESVLEEQSLPQPIIDASRWMSSYYQTPLAIVLQTVLPSGLEKHRRVSEKPQRASHRKRTHFLLNDDQRRAVTQISSAAPGTMLLHGVTGSGKTAIYIELAKQVIAASKSVIVLVPEIALTSQVIDEFSHDFPNCIVTHSKQTESERHTIWRTVLNATTPMVVIGPRSALFMPLRDVGLIVVDEAHEPSYKQEQSPRYNALRTANQLAMSHGARLVLGSATPLVTDYFLAHSTKRPVIVIDKPAVTAATKPTITMVDMTKHTSFTRHRFFSNRLLAQLDEDLAASKQILLFHNRRGSASVTLCEDCGWQAGCGRCFVPLTLHGDRHELRCHICGMQSRVPTACPTCSSVDIIHKGIGTKLIETELAKLYPKASIARFDGDNSSEEGVDARYKELYEGSIDIIIGTQVVAKGLDLPKLRTVGVVQADAGLSLPDYSSPERTFQLLAQVVGRVGRGTHESNVIVQSYQPNHPVIQAGLGQNYAAFYDSTLALRKRSNFPPFTYLLKLTCIYKTEASAIKNARKLAAELAAVTPQDVQILGPTPSFYERVRDTYRWQLVLKSPKRQYLLDALNHLPSTHWQFELDPGSLL